MIKKLSMPSYHQELTAKTIQVLEKKNKSAAAKRAQETQKILAERLKQVEIEILGKKEIEKNKMVPTPTTRPSGRSCRTCRT
jgi:hypothetical protein